MTLFPNALLALNKLGLADDVIASGFTLRTGNIQDFRGRLLAQYAFDSLEKKLKMPSVGISRVVLHDLLLSRIPANLLKLGYECKQIEQDQDKASLFFSNKVKTNVDWVVGADGLHSKVRTSVFGPMPLRYSGQLSYRGITEIPTGYVCDFFETWGKGQRFGAVRIDANRIYWWAVFNAIPGLSIKDKKTAKTFLLNRYQGWHHPIQQLIHSSDPLIQADIFDLRPSKLWYRNRVVLLGDAIHPITPNLGQGAAMALESAVALLEVFEQYPIDEAACKAYQSRRYLRTTWMNRGSWWFGKLAQSESGLVSACRNLAMKATPQWAMGTMDRLLKPDFS